MEGATVPTHAVPKGAVSTPVEIKAQAVALHAMGYSCRKIEKQLRAKFRKADIPNYATVARWVRRPHAARAANRLAIMRWNEAACRAGEIVLDRLDEIRTQPLDKVVVCYGRIMDIAVGLEKLSRQC